MKEDMKLKKLESIDREISENDNVILVAQANIAHLKMMKNSIIYDTRGKIISVHESWTGYVSLNCGKFSYHGNSQQSDVQSMIDLFSNKIDELKSVGYDIGIYITGINSYRPMMITSINMGQSYTGDNDVRLQVGQEQINYTKTIRLTEDEVLVHLDSLDAPKVKQKFVNKKFAQVPNRGIPKVKDKIVVLKDDNMWKCRVMKFDGVEITYRLKEDTINEAYDIDKHKLVEIHRDNK